MKRTVLPELLDSLPPDDPRALGSRRDLRRLNWWMGNHRSMRRALRAHLPGQSPGPLMEIGAGDGNFLLSVVKGLSLAGPARRITLLDRQRSVSPAILSTFNELGWQTDSIVADVFECPPLEQPAAAIVANLFLHHFEDEALARLLAKMAGQTKLFMAIEPRRFAQPWLCGQALRLIGCNSVTLHDAEASVRAGFQQGELPALWPDKTNWQLTDQRAGLFSYLFIARKIS